MDDAGVKIWVQPSPKANVAGIFELGDPKVIQGGLLGGTAVVIPRGGSHFTYVCPDSETAKWTGDITVFGSILHMHKMGAQMYTEVTPPSGGATGATKRNHVQYFDFDHQDPTLISSYVIKKGSTLTTRCYYDNTLPASQPLVFGLGSEQEMCTDFIYYYPADPSVVGCAPATMPTAATIDFASDAGSRVFGVAPGTSSASTCTGRGVSVYTPPTSTNACPQSDTLAITTTTGACKCASASTTNECAVQSYCWLDNTCSTTAKSTGGTGASACTLSDAAAIAAACQCASTSTTNECAVGKYCWLSKTCSTAAKPSPTACTASDTAAITTACKCASESTTNECAAQFFCWSTSARRTCSAIPKPPPPVVGTPNAIVTAKVFLKGFTCTASACPFKEAGNTHRVAFVDNLQTRASTAASCSKSDIIVTIVAVASGTSARRRRLASAGIEVEFSVEAPGISTADLSSDLNSYLSDTSAAGFAAQLPADSSGNAITSEVVDAPAAQSKSGPPAGDSAADDLGLTLGLVFGIGGAALVLVAVVVGVIVVVVVVAGKKKQTPLAGDDGAVVTGAVITKGDFEPELEMAPLTTPVDADADKAAYVEPAAPATMSANPISAVNIEERRLADDGEHYTKAEFAEHYGGDDEWDAATPKAETRVADDGESYTKAEFIEHYGGTTEWDDAYVI